MPLVKPPLSPDESKRSSDDNFYGPFNQEISSQEDHAQKGREKISFQEGHTQEDRSAESPGREEEVGACSEAEAGQSGACAQTGQGVPVEQAHGISLSLIHI